MSFGECVFEASRVALLVSWRGVSKRRKAPANARGLARRAGPGPISGVPNILGAVQNRISGIPENSPVALIRRGYSIPQCLQKSA